MASTIASIGADAVASGLFDRIICGIDDSEESLDAARQAACLLAPGGSLHLHAVADVAMFRRAGRAVAPGPDAIVASLNASLERAVREVVPATSRLTTGAPIPTLLRRLQEEDATLLALGAHEHRRMAGVLMGSVATTLLHRAPCSILLARRQRSEPWPGWICVGVDGSAEAATAFAVARNIRARFGAGLVTLAALGGKKIERQQVARAYPTAKFVARPPVDALLAISEVADLLVVGSRGLHGIRALGSVSERIAHVACGSVLIVRPTHEGAVRHPSPLRLG